MRNHKEIEESVLKLWKEQGICKKLSKHLEDSKQVFIFTDGPPYATGQIHPGTGWNKCMKDCVLRHRMLKGYKVIARPGYDTHGLPIEVKVEQKLALGLKKDIEQKIGVEKFVEECKAFATQYMGIMSSDFERLGVWMDWNDPYVTYKDVYIDRTWQALKAVWDKGLIYQDVYVLADCPRCQTTVANYELEYSDHKSPSIYVKFKLKGKENEYLIIWTTTPWTLVANMAVMAHPMLEYVKVQAGEEKWIVAKALLDNVVKASGIGGVAVLEEFAGKYLDKLEYEHPLQNLIGKKCARRVVMSDEYVTTENGSGLVHTAPGHGPEDFIIGKRYGIEVYCPVDEKGVYDSSAGKYSGKGVFECNDTIIKDLKASGALLSKSQHTHRYPHCWRCKTPLIFVSSRQWFIRITELKDKMLEEIEKVSWHPDFAKTRFRDFVLNAPDWCISRQRYWGIPLPIWQCENPECKSRQFIGSLKQLSDLGHMPKELHRPYIDKVHLKCSKCGGEMSRIPDILDVWFDSGNAVWAGALDPETYSAEFIVEGKDQTRGWFYSLLGMGVAYKGFAPYRNVLMHGFFVDLKGEKMSKSVGNYVPLDEIINKHGADAFRLWSLGATPWDDLKFSWEDMANANRALEIIHNMGVYLKRAYGFQKKLDIPKSNLEIEDRWILSRLNAVIKEADASFMSYNPHKAVQVLKVFLVEELSRTYLKLAKGRIDSKDELASSIFYKCLLDALVLLQPIAPFISESIYQSFYKQFEAKHSIAFMDYPSLKQGFVDISLEAKVAVALEIKTAIISMRNKAGINVRQPLEEALFYSASALGQEAVASVGDIACRLANVKKLSSVQELDAKVSLSLNRNSFGSAFKQKSAEAMAYFSKADPKELLMKVLEHGYVEYESQKLGLEFFGFEAAKEGYSCSITAMGVVMLNTSISNTLFSEGYANEIIRRIQEMRKSMSLVESDAIEFSVQNADHPINWADIEHAVNGKKTAKLPDSYYKEWDVKGEKLRIGIRKK